jgi:hypothetical protein
VQHGFSDDPSFNNDNYKVPTTTGIKLPDAIKAYLDNPSEITGIWIQMRGQATGAALG